MNCGVGVFLTADERVQVRLGTQRVDATQTGERITDADVAAKIAAKKRLYSPSEVKQQVDEARSRTRVNLSLAFSRFGALKERMGMKSDAELARFLLDR